MSFLRLAICPTCGSTRKAIGLGYAAAVAGREDVFPLLARALRDADSALSTRIEWVANGGTFFNWTQIIRTPFGMSGTELTLRDYTATDWDDVEDEALALHLHSVEQTLRYGKRATDHGPSGEPLRKMGGVIEFLGREPRDEDTIRLRILRDLTLLPNRHMPDRDGVEHEWLGEISLQVTPG
jgi:hypothetical protein